MDLYPYIVFYFLILTNVGLRLIPGFLKKTLPNNAIKLSISQEWWWLRKVFV